MKKLFTFLLILLLVVSIACEFTEDLLDEFGEDEVESSEIEPPVFTPDITPPPPAQSPEIIQSKWDLWSSDATLLRGANIWQAVVVLKLDGPTFKGSGPVGPPYTQADFDRLASLGANYVTVSGPGLFTEKPPFTADMPVVAYLDDLLDKIAKADLFATIAFRTGPGRSEFTLCCGGDSYYDGYFNDTVWTDRAAQDAWVEMWRFTAERYRNNPIVVGYKLMVEPNAAEVFFDLYEPDEFYSQHSGSSYDWNQFYPGIVQGIREVDKETPILVGGEGYSAIEWLSHLQTVGDPRIVYVAHQYAPFEYTHQDQGGQDAYPGRFDLDYDGSPDNFNRAWLESLVSPIVQYSSQHDAPVAVDEFGVNRWVPGGADYMNDLMNIFETYGINYSIWEWQTSWEEFRIEVHDMDFRLGPDPDNLEETSNQLQDVITSFWQLNVFRPSNVPWAP